MLSRELYILLILLVSSNHSICFVISSTFSRIRSFFCSLMVGEGVQSRDFGIGQLKALAFLARPHFCPQDPYFSLLFVDFGVGQAADVHGQQQINHSILSQAQHLLEPRQRDTLNHTSHTSAPLTAVSTVNFLKVLSCF